MDTIEAYRKRKIRRLADRFRKATTEAEKQRLALIIIKACKSWAEREDEWDETLHPRDEQGRFTNEGGIMSPLIDGPSQSDSYIDSYMSDHPDVKAEIQNYMDVLDNVQNFAKDHPDAEEGTYDAVTGEAVDMSTVNGFCVTFHQNLSLENPYGAYTKETYAALCAIAKNELGTSGVNIGYFGGAAEVSFTCPDQSKVVDFAIAHNQHSVFDPDEGEAVENAYFNKKTNIISGH